MNDRRNLAPRLCRLPVIVCLLLAICGNARGAPGNSEVTWQQDRKPAIPWAVQIVRVPRRSALFELRSVHATGRAVGLATVSQQIAATAQAPGRPLAAVNGDFYERDGAYAGDSRGLQIVVGELISAPVGGVSFWIDAVGEPHATNVTSQLTVTWPNGATMPLTLNSERSGDAAALFTPAMGKSTRTSGGREFVLEPAGNGPWLPLQASREYVARVREARATGDSPLAPGTMMLSLGPQQARSLPAISTGAVLKISTATTPSLRGVRTAISGGPVLVRDGKPQRIRVPAADSYQFSSMFERHPRSAVGWNDDFFFLVTVDGRQPGWSVGMTLKELATYLADLGCREAMNLDGGGSATLWYGGRVRNRPCDGHERPLANALVVMERPAKTGIDPTTTKAAAPRAETNESTEPHAK